MPAGTSTRLQPCKHSPSTAIALSSRLLAYPATFAFFSKCPKSAATPCGGTIATVRSYTESSPTFGSQAMSKDSGWPMPPEPPQTHTLKFPFLAPNQLQLAGFCSPCETSKAPPSAPTAEKAPTRHAQRAPWLEPAAERALQLDARNDPNAGNARERRPNIAVTTLA